MLLRKKKQFIKPLKGFCTAINISYSFFAHPPRHLTNILFQSKANNWKCDLILK